MVVFKRRILRRIFLFAVVTQLTAGVPLYGQHTTTPPEKDSTTLAHSLKHLGAFQGHIRSFFMATDNASPMTDAAALAFGAGISYESPRIHGFQLGLAGFFIFNLGSTDLGKRDSLSNAYNRYEIGLFDLSNAGNKKDLDRLEDLYLKYHFRSSRLEAGRFELNTPFINRQDGRMRGTIEEGVWMEMNEIRKLRVEAGWIWKISPRSTVAWYE
ncbi:MAG: OprD family outer membrane porin, partial [Bacteroidia bacterium]|nr:OprD family outer membrane porin [Bacteroidia bacterium]